MSDPIGGGGSDRPLPPLPNGSGPARAGSLAGSLRARNWKPDALRVAILLVGSLLITAQAVSRLPPARELFVAPATPFDRSGLRGTVPVYRFLSDVRSAIPRNASVIVISEPRERVRENAFYPIAVALLPGRLVLSPARESGSAAELGRLADFLIVYGGVPSPAPGTLVRSSPQGTVWSTR